MKHEISWPGSSVFQLLPLKNPDWLGTSTLREILCFLVLKRKFHCNSVNQNAPALLFFNVILHADSGRTHTDSKRLQWNCLTELFHFPYDLQYFFVWLNLFVLLSAPPLPRKHLYSQRGKDKSSYGIFSVECITVSAFGCDLKFYSETMLLLAESLQHTFIAILLSVFWLCY